MEKEDLSYRGLFLFSLPSILSSLLEPLSGTIDTALVGQVSTEWLAGLALAVTLISSFTWMFNFLVHASTQSIASSLGSEPERVSESIKTALFVALLVGVISTLFLWLAKPLLFELVGVTKRVYVHTDSYFSIRLLGHTFTLLYTTLVSLLRGLGRVNVSFFMVGFTTLINGVVTYLALFVFDWGLEGAAWGTAGSFTLGSLISFIIIIKDKHVAGSFFGCKIKKDKWFQFGKNSLNIFGRSLTLTTCFFVSTRVAAQIDLHQLAAHQILLQIWLFGSFLLDGVAVTGTVLGAQYYAKGEIGKVKMVYSRLLKLAIGIGVAFTIVYWFGEEPILKIFSSDLYLLSFILSFWALIALSQVPNAIAFVYDGFLFGLEEFAYLRKHMIIGGLVCFLPFVFLGLENRQIFYVWMGMVLLNIYRGASGYLRVRSVLNG